MSMCIRSLPLVLSSGLLCSGVAFAAAAPTLPVLTYSTYLRDGFTPTAIATDVTGNIYIAGNAVVDPGAPQTTVLVMKLNPQSNQYLYVRYLGGSVNDQVNSIAVDLAGDAYIAGATQSPDFPVTSGGNLAQAPSSTSQRSFVAKLDPNGELVFSDLLGGFAASAAQAVAVTAANQILVSGTSTTSGFPSTGGAAYNIANSAGHPYLLELDPTGTSTIFAATGIGGSAIAVDSSGNIYVAGTTYLLDYPTTPGAYQTTFPVVSGCLGPSCFSQVQGANQYVTKINSSGSKLIYSTAVTGKARTMNGGLAVDAAGDVYLTGFAGGTYPYTVTVPTLPISVVPFASPFLSKLDPAGQTLLFSIPAGGAGVQADSSGSVYVGGTVGIALAGSFAVPANLPALTSVPAPCLPNVSAQTIGTSQNIRDSAYVAEVDGASGNLRGTQFIGGSTLTATAVALAGSTLWVAGATSFPDFPFTPNALTSVRNFASAPLPGAYLGAVDFSRPQPPAGTPQIGCIVDAADLAPAGPVALEQLLTIFGTGLGPVTGVGAPNGSIEQLAGVNVNFGSSSAPLLYVSSTQINLAVPLVPNSQTSTPIQVDVNGVFSLPLELPLTYANPSVFPVTLNADGSVNSSTNPAHLGSAVSVFVNGLTPDPQINNSPLQLYSNNGWSVTNVAQATPFVLQIGLQVPSKLKNDFACPSPSLCTASFTIYDVYGGSPISGLSFGGAVYITETP
jgi:uncharacterized protein (TIGR03437 family)